jgi:hypothetical protein
MNPTTRPIRTFANGDSLEYDTGVFDNWCTYLCNPDGTRNPPRDAEYFSTLAELGKMYGSQRVYSDVKKIFVLTGKEINEKVFDYISLVSKEYSDDSPNVEILFTILYAAFISEENKANTKLGKRIKFLGIHQILIEGMNPEIAANFSKGMAWRDIAKLCDERRF